MVRYFIHHPTAANLLMGGLLLMGILTLDQIKREAMPDFSTQTLQISANYPGATAEEIEEAVATPIEEALENVNNVKRINTTAMEGGVSIRVEMVEGADFAQFHNEIKTEVEAVSSFPNELEKLIVKPFEHTDRVVSVAITGPMSVTHLKAYCENLKDKILRAADGAQVSISGFGQREFRIEIAPQALDAYQLSLKDVSDIIRKQNTNLPAGTLETGDQDIKLRFNDRRKTVHDLADIHILSGETGSELKLGDIATITDGYDDEGSKVLFNGRRAGVLNITKSKSEDSLNIYDKVMEVLAAEEAKSPLGLTFTITRDMASEIKDRLRMVALNAVQGLILVFCALWLFLNFKLSFWVTMGLPVSFLGGLFFMHLLGISLNMISTFALLIAIGLLMDDAIVLAENVAAHLSRGESVMTAAVNGVREVARGVVSSYATTICVFLPLIFLSGQIGKILRVVPYTLIIVLSMSLIEAFLIMPHHLAHSFRNGAPPPPPLRRRIDAIIEFIRLRVVGGVVGRIVTYRYLFLASLLGFFIFSVALLLAGYVKFAVFPSVDGDTATVKVMLPPGTPLSESEEVAERICEGVKRVNETLKVNQPGGVDLVKSVSVQFGQNRDTQDSGPHLFTVYADLLSGDVRRNTLSEVLGAWRVEVGDIPGAVSVKFEDMMEGPGGKPIAFRLQGPDRDELKVASAELRDKLRTYQGVFDVSDNLFPGKTEVVMRLKPGALKLGFTAQDIATQLRAAYEGAKADELQIGSDNFEYNVRMTYDIKKNIRNFDNFLLSAADGCKVPLASVVAMRSERGLSSVNRYNGKRTVTVSADVNDREGNASEILNEISKHFLPELSRKYPNVIHSHGGRREAGNETGFSMGRSFLIGLAGIFILLALQFKSYLEPFVVLSAIPLAGIGAIWGHFLLGAVFNLQSLIGLVALSGVVVNDSILMMEFIKINEANGVDPGIAAKQAASDRFRALTLTSLTTMAGLLPLLTEKSLQAQMIIPLAISIVFGLAASTLLVLFAVPTLNMVLLDWRGWREEVPANP